jgi:hypothetical protein
MATIFEQLESTLSGADLPATLDTQIGGLAQVGTTVAGLIDHPPQGIEGLLGSVKALPLPDVGLGTELPATLQSLQAAVPTDIGDVLGAITGNLADLSALATGELGSALTAGLGPVLALRKLLELDLSCFHDEPAGPPPPPPPPGTPPAGTQRTAAALDQAHAALTSLPDTITIEDIVALLARGIDLESFTQLPIPILDDLREGIATLLDWSTKTPAQIVASLAETLTALRTFVTDSVNAAFGTLAADAQAAVAQLNASPLNAVADALVTHLDAIRDAADLSTTGAHVTAINAALDQLAAATLPDLASLKARLTKLPAALHDQVGHIESALGPPGSAPLTFPGDDPLTPVGAEIISEIDGVLSPAVGWLQDIAAKLDLSALADPIHTAAEKVDDAVPEVETALATVTTEVQQLFAQLESLLDELDTTAIVDALKDSLDAFGTAVTNQLASLFAPIKGILGEAIGALDDAVAGFDPATVVDALQDLIDQLAGVLDDPSIKAAREQIEGAFATAEQQLGALSFAPVTDQVLSAIDTITNALNALDPSLLSGPAQLALQGAVALLPSDLDPLTDPLLDDFQALVDSGPGALVEQVRAPVAQLQEQVRGFEPAALVGDALTKPFQDAVGKLEGFKPSALLEPVEQELDRLKQRLAKELGPAKLLQPLNAPCDDLLEAFDRLDPAQLVQPLEDAILGVVDTILDALPIDEILGPVGSVLNAVQGVADVLKQGKDVLTALSGLLDKLGGAPDEIEAWVDGVLAKIADAAPLQAPLQALVTAVADTNAAQLGQRANFIDPLLAAIPDRLPAIAQAQRAINLDAFPASPQKAAVQNALERANPLGPALTTTYGALGTVRREVAAAQQSLTAELAAWDARYHAPNGPLAQIAALQATPQSLQQWLKDAAEPQIIKPVRALLAPAGPVKAALGPALTQLGALLTDLEGKVATFGTGPGSAGAIKTAIDELVERLRTLDLDFLKQGLAGVFAGVRGKLTAIGPQALAPLLQDAFDQALGALDLGSVLPQAQIDQLDADVAKVVDALKALDPDKLIVDAVQPVYDEKVAPLIDAFDFTGVVDALLAALHGLREELASELERVNQGYQAMLAAVPALEALSIDVADVGDLF